MSHKTKPNCQTTPQTGTTTHNIPKDGRLLKDEQNFFHTKGWIIFVIIWFAILYFLVTTFIGGAK